MKHLISNHKYILVVVIYISYCTYYHSVSANSCQNFDTQSIINSRIDCQLHDTLINLNDYRHNITNRAIHIIPDVAPVRRCGGTCASRSHRCVPLTTHTKRIPVMAILAHYPHGIHEQQCGYIHVEEHLSCRCGCPIRPEECTRQPGVARRFDASTCRCLCTDTAARSRCISSGKNWDESNCRCVCPVSLWWFCSTGYVFDYENTCNCIPTSMTASLGLIAAIIVLITCILGTMVGGFIMYRRKTGIFRKARAIRYSLHQDEKKTAIFKDNDKKPTSHMERASIITETINLPT